MKFRNVMTDISSDSTLIQATADYFDSRTEKAISFSDDLSYIISEHDSQDYVRPDLDYSLEIEVDSESLRSMTVDVGQLATAIEADADEFTDSATGVVVEVDDCIDQLSSSISTMRVITCALHTLAVSATESAAAITASFIASATTIVGVVTASTASLISDLTRILISSGKSVGQRIKDLLAYIGLYDVPQDAELVIGFPPCAVNDVTGANVWTAFFAEVPKDLQAFGEWIVDTAKKILKLFSNVMEVVVGSAVYRSIAKFFNTLALQADSFEYNNGAAEDDTISNGGFSGMTSIGYMPELYLGSGIYDVSTIWSSIALLYCAVYPYSYNKPTAASLASMTILELCEGVLSYIDQVTSHSGSYDRENTYVKWIISRPPGWQQIPDSFSSLDSSVIPIGSSYSLLEKAAWLCCYLFYVQYGTSFTGYSDQGIYELLSYAVGTYLDHYHLNDISNFRTHLNTRSYFKIDLPGSSLYFWLVGNQVCFTRRVRPLTEFMNFSSADKIIQYFTQSFNSYQYLQMCNFWYKGQGVLRQKVFGFFGLMNDLRTSSSAPIPTTDEEMIKSCFASNLADSLYLLAIYGMHLNSYDYDYEWPDELSPHTIVGLNFGSQNRNQAFRFVKLLTGHSLSDLLAIARKSSADISNIDLSVMVGADAEYVDFDALGVQSEVELPAVFMYYFSHIGSLDVAFLPYTHVSDIAYGSYSIMTDAQLAKVSTLALKIVAAIAAVLFLMKAMKKLKKKSMALRTQADATSWSMIEQDKYDQAAINRQYKMYKRANRCEKLSQAIFGSVSKTVSAVGSSITSATSAMTSKIKTLITGSSPSGSADPTIKDAIDNVTSVHEQVSTLQSDVTDTKDTVNTVSNDVESVVTLIKGSD